MHLTSTDRTFSDDISTDRFPVSNQHSMALWKPPGVNKTSPAKWESHPERTTFFLEILCQEKVRMIVGQPWPNNATYNTLTQEFWSRYSVYQGKDQFRNHYRVKRNLWSEIRYEKLHTGLGWDPKLKIFTADEDSWKWAQEHKRALFQYRNRSIPDYELLEQLFSDERARGDYMRPPISETRRGTSETRRGTEEGSGDSSEKSPERFSDPNDGLDEMGQASMAPQSGEKRRGGTPTVRRKKARGSPMSRMEKLANKLMASRDVDTTTNDTPFTHCIDIFTKEFSLIPGTPIYNGITSLIARYPGLAVVFLTIHNRVLQWDWIRQELHHHHPQGSGYNIPIEPPPPPAFVSGNLPDFAPPPGFRNVQ